MQLTEDPRVTLDLGLFWQLNLSLNSCKYPCYQCLKVNERSAFSLTVPTVENGEKLCSRMCFCFFFHAKLGTTNNHRNRSSNLSY